MLGRSSLAAVAFAGLGLLRNPGCGGVDDPEGGPNAPCTRSSDCGGDLQCREGVCREPGEPIPVDAGDAVDAGEGELDASADAG